MKRLSNLSKIPAPRSHKPGWPWTEETDPSLYSKEIEWPKISIVTPSYNQGAYIEETIRSILLQNYPNFEYIIIDGGSKDNSIDTIEKYSPWISFWVSEPDNGQSHAINKGLSRATGQILTWINSDDFYAPNALYHIAKNWQQGIGILIGVGHIINTGKEILYTPQEQELSYEKLRYWIRGNDFTQPAAFFSIEAWEEAGPLDEDLFFCMDVDLWLKISKKFPILQIPETLAYAYSHENAKTTAFREKMMMETILMLARNGEFEVAKEEGSRFLEELNNRSNKLSTRAAFKIIRKNIKNRLKKLFLIGR